MYERGESSFRGTSLSTRFWFVNARASRTSDSVRPTDAVEGPVSYTHLTLPTIYSV